MLSTNIQHGQFQAERPRTKEDRDQSHGKDASPQQELLRPRGLGITSF